MAELRQRFDEKLERRVAFAVYPSTTTAAANNDTIIPFDVAMTNIGNAFDTQTHLFTAPFDGPYYFTLNLNAKGVKNDLTEFFYLRYKETAVALADNDDKRSTLYTAHTVVELKQGDVLSVVIYSDNPKFVVDEGIDNMFVGLYLG